MTIEFQQSGWSTNQNSDFVSMKSIYHVNDPVPFRHFIIGSPDIYMSVRQGQIWTTEIRPSIPVLYT